MKKIIFRNNLFIGGGVEKVLYNLVTFLVSDGYDVTVISDYGCRSDFYKIFDKKIHFITSNCFWGSKNILLRGINKLYRQLYKIRIKFFLNCDVAIAIKEGPSMIEISKMNVPKKIGWVHVDYNYLHWTKNFFESNDDEKNCMKIFDSIICVSNAAKESVITVIGDPGNLCVRYNPIDFKTIRQKAKEKIALKKPTKILLVTIGRLDPIKQYDLLIKATNELIKKYDFELWIIGDGPERENLENIINDNKISNVKLLGDLTNPYPYLGIADCFISSAKSESYGLAIQEALILGVPVIAAECPAVLEVFDKDYGIITPNDCDGLVNGMNTVLSSPDVLKKYKDNIRKSYDCESVFENRLRDICSVWED